MMKMWARFGAVVFGLAVFGLLMSGQSGTARSKAGASDFVIAAADGYGTTDCLAGASACGQIVADAWCAAHGFDRALSYKPVSPDEITGSTGRGPMPAAYHISCAR